MSTALGMEIVEDFIRSSRSCIDTIVNDLRRFKGDSFKINLFNMKNDQVNQITFDGGHLFLRSSVEYSNPQLTVEEVQGIIAARLIEVCGNYFAFHKVSEADKKDFFEICEFLNQPPKGKIIPFLLNTDDIEPDRYSMNPLKESILKSGQSAFPSAKVKVEDLKIDEKFVEKYKNTLISKYEIELIKYHLSNCNNSYTDMVDAVKYDHLETLSGLFGMDLRLPMMRLPITFLEKEGTDGLLHNIISKSHQNYESIERVYNWMGRSMKKRTTLLTIPHSKKGFGSKRAARGKIYFEGTKLKSIKVTYKPTPLYENAIDPDDISIADANDQFTVPSDKLINYNYAETPSSPQFILYTLASPEDAVIWHGVGEWGASNLVKSYTSTRIAYNKNPNNLYEKYELIIGVPSQFNLVPEKYWVHPVHRNIDASIGCVENLKDLAKMGMKLECLTTQEYIRT